MTTCSTLQASPPLGRSPFPRPSSSPKKIHAYTYQWTDRENKRSRDLVDMVVLIERGNMDPAAIRRAIVETFARRVRHALPSTLQPPPASWAAEFSAMAIEAGASATDIAPAFEILNAFWLGNKLGGSDRTE